MINEIIKEYFCDIAGISTNTNFNDAIRAGLEKLGYSGGLNNMLRSWANSQAGTTNASVTDAYRLAMADMIGESSTFVGDLAKEYAGVTWDTILTPWEDEHRLWNYID